MVKDDAFMAVQSTFQHESNMSMKETKLKAVVNSQPDKFLHKSVNNALDTALQVVLTEMAVAGVTAYPEKSA